MSREALPNGRGAPLFLSLGLCDPERRIGYIPLQGVKNQIMRIGTSGIIRIPTIQ